MNDVNLKTCTVFAQAIRPVMITLNTQWKSCMQAAKTWVIRTTYDLHYKPCAAAARITSIVSRSDSVGYGQHKAASRLNVTNV